MHASSQAPGSARGESAAIKALERVIAGHPFLQGLKPEHLRLLATSAMRTHYAAGTLIFHEGSPANRLHLIERGRVSLESHPKDEAPATVQVLGAGDVLGWSWLFPPCYWHFDGRALEPTTVILFHGTRLRERCDQEHDLGYEMMKRMTQLAMQRLQAARRKLLGVRRQSSAIPRAKARP